MEYIKLNGKDQPFRFGLKALKELESAVTPEKFNNIITGQNGSFSDNILIAENILRIGLNHGAKKAGEKYVVTPEKAEDMIDEGGMEFLESVLALFEKCVSSPKELTK
jgi:hypothetical protein